MDKCIALDEEQSQQERIDEGWLLDDNCSSAVEVYSIDYDTQMTRLKLRCCLRLVLCIVFHLDQMT